MSRESLTAAKRESAGSPVARRLRRTGRVPGVVYSQRGNLPFSVDALELAAALRHGATLIDIDVDGTKLTTVIKDHHVHPVRGDILHVDLQEVRMDETITSTIALHFVGTAAGVKEGGVLSEATHEITVESTPGNIPEALDVDVSDLDIGQSLHLHEISLPDGVVSHDDPDTVLASVTAPRAATEEVTEEAPEGAAEAPAQPSGAGGAADAAEQAAGE